MPTNPISGNVICLLICHAMLWKFIPLYPTSAFLLPKYLKSLHTHSLLLLGAAVGSSRVRLPVLNSKDNDRASNCRNGSATLDCSQFPRHCSGWDWQRTLILYFLTFLFLVLKTEMFWFCATFWETSFFFVTRRITALHATFTIWNLTTKTLKGGRMQCTIHLFSWQPLDCREHRKLAQD